MNFDSPMYYVIILPFIIRLWTRYFIFSNLVWYIWRGMDGTQKVHIFLILPPDSNHLLTCSSQPCHLPTLLETDTLQLVPGVAFPFPCSPSSKNTSCLQQQEENSSLSLSKIAGVLNIARLDGSIGVRWRAIFFYCVKRFKKAISKRRNYKTNVILLSVRKKVFLNEPIVTLSENILLEIRCQHTRRARKHVLLEFLCKQSKSSLY